MSTTLETRDPATPVLAELAFCRLTLEWNSLASETEGDVALPSQADETALACVLLSVEWGNGFTAAARDTGEANVQLALARWSVPAYANADALPWQLCGIEKTADGNQQQHVAYLVRSLTHPQSSVRTWMMQLAWMIRPWLDRDQVLPLLLKNVADTLGGVRTAMGLAHGLCTTDKELEAHIRGFQTEYFKEQFTQRVEQFRSEGFALSEGHLWEMEARCRRRIEQAVFGTLSVRSPTT